MNEKVSPYNPNTRVLEIRTDGWPVLDLEADNLSEALGKLSVWAKRQVESWQGDSKIKDGILNGANGGSGLNNTHPADVVPFLISMEPVLMLSNLPVEQLTKIENLLNLCDLVSSSHNYSNSDQFLKVADIVGAFRLGKQTQEARSIIQSSGS